MRNEIKQKLERFLSREIAIEYKACLYFSCILFFYSVWLIVRQSYFASVWIIWEVVFTAYAVSYLQVYFLQNVDEAERLGKKEVLRIALCICLYTGISWGFGWFGRSLLATVLFAAYMLLCYVSIYLCNKIKREIDTKHLNRMLTEYKQGAGHD